MAHIPGLHHDMIARGVPCWGYLYRDRRAVRRMASSPRGPHHCPSTPGEPSQPTHSDASIPLGGAPRQAP